MLPVVWKICNQKACSNKPNDNGAKHDHAITPAVHVSIH